MSVHCETEKQVLSLLRCSIIAKALGEHFLQNNSLALSVRLSVRLSVPYFFAIFQLNRAKIVKIDEKFTKID
jgi:hypothetical protein